MWCLRRQTRFRELIDVLDKVGPRFGSLLIAYAWIRSVPLPGFSGATAMSLIQEGRADDVLEYIDGVDAGVFA
ncbi:antitoxin Xre/MbcA/ParS toxin-binding domain-containing protein [Sphingobium sp. B8D3A]|uniref:antitoxin Xre/MbcA/ParS toxin-binding domain-containing protein n=1 Tax=Sphingobium sp. B8D3A TaxID=2940584 RepID=UPI0039B64EC8